MFGLLLIAGALGMSNFAAAIGIGLSGVDRRTRARVAAVFGLFEALMPLLGLVVGDSFGRSLGSLSSSVGGGLLMATGLFALVRGRRHRPDPSALATGLGRLVVTGAALSVDNLVVGFALGTQGDAVIGSAAVIAVVSVAMALCGLELGNRLAPVAGRWSEDIGGVVLIMVGAAIWLGLL